MGCRPRGFCFVKRSVYHMCSFVSSSSVSVPRTVVYAACALLTSGFISPPCYFTFPKVRRAKSCMPRLIFRPTATRISWLRCTAAYDIGVSKTTLFLRKTTDPERLPRQRMTSTSTLPFSISANCRLMSLYSLLLLMLPNFAAAVIPADA